MKWSKGVNPQPHQGSRECGRRIEQMQRGQIHDHYAQWQACQEGRKLNEFTAKIWERKR
jgi:hypothetical protein